MEMNQYKKMHHGLGGVFFLSLVALPGGGCEVQVIVDLHQVHHNHHQITNQWQLKIWIRLEKAEIKPSPQE